MQSETGSESGGAPGMAGVGIFFQQEPSSQLVFVRTIVPGGAAHRSKQVFVGDVVTKVNNQDVRGQPLHILRTVILGRQGEYVTIEFVRPDGSTHTVTLQRGSPEFFDAQEREATSQTELDMLRREVIELGRRHAVDQEEIARLRVAADAGAGDQARRVRALEEAIARKDEEIARLHEAQRATEVARHHVEAQMGEVQSRQVPILEELRRYEEKERARLDFMEDMKRRMDEEKQRADAHIRRLEQDNRTERASREEAEHRESRLIEELRKRLDEERFRREREVDLKRRFELERKGVTEAHRINESIAMLLRETGPRLSALENDMFAPHVAAAYHQGDMR